MNKGKVYLVGAGPGDPGSMTLKSLHLIRRADVILYDHLIGASIAAMLPDRAELIPVGKHAGDHTMKQEDINDLLVKKAMEGKTVVRLKGGDPFLFGRGGEELELLAANDIPFEVVPGVSSATAVPAYFGIPLTHREYSSSVHVITGHRKKDGRGEIPYEILARSEGTLVFLMGVSALPEICSRLIDAGMSPDTPAALLQQGSLSSQQSIRAVLGTLAGECKKHVINTPGIIVVGEVCKLQEKFSWYEKLPLAGKRIIVTRPAGNSRELCMKLRKEGAEVIQAPSIRLTPVSGDDEKRLCNALSGLSGYDWIVFTSPSGVRFFFEKLQSEKIDIRKLLHLKFAVLGEGTGRELSKHGIFADAVPGIFNGESLGRLLSNVCRKNEKILLPRAKRGNPDIIERLKGFSVDDVPLYETAGNTVNTIDETGMIESGEVDYVIFTSASTVEGFVMSNPGLNYRKVNALCIGCQTASFAEEYGMHTVVSRSASADALTDLVLSQCEKTPAS